MGKIFRNKDLGADVNHCVPVLGRAEPGFGRRSGCQRAKKLPAILK
jgi:hypothetical protein